MTQTTVNLDFYTLKALDKLVRELGLSRSEGLQQAVADYLEKWKDVLGAVPTSEESYREMLREELRAELKAETELLSDGGAEADLVPGETYTRVIGEEEQAEYDQRQREKQQFAAAAVERDQIASEEHFAAEAADVARRVQQKLGPPEEGDE